MRRRLALVLVCLLASLAVGCEAGPPSVDRGLAVRFPGSGTLYPGSRAYDCAAINRCADVIAEVARWATWTAPELGEPASVTFHGAIDAAGQEIMLSRSGGGTWIAVVTWPDGTRRAVVVGCGVGIDWTRCFSES